MLALLPPNEQAKILEGFSEEDFANLEYDWRFWARPNQIEPQGDWLTWLALAGRGFGKTRLGSEWVIEGVRDKGWGRIALVAETAADARDVMVEGDSGILACSPPKDRPLYEPSKRRLTWSNGAQATLFNAVEPDQLRGPQFHAAWCDELAKWKKAQQAWDQLQFGLRLGVRPQALVTTTPRPIPLIRELIKSPDTHVTRGSTMDNAANLAPSFLAKIQERYGGTRLGRQEIEAELLEDIPGALWTLSQIDEYRVDAVPEMQRIVVAVDPSGVDGENEKADEVGIIVAGLGVDGRGYVLADRTCSLGPAGWGRTVVNAYHEFQADRIVAERNYGGAMVKFVIKTADPSAAYKEVTASRGKSVRAEPIAALYEQGRISHHNSFGALENQMITMTAGGYMGDGSPDRLDSMVWAFTELMVSPRPIRMVAEEPILIEG